MIAARSPAWPTPRQPSWNVPASGRTTLGRGGAMAQARLVTHRATPRARGRARCPRGPSGPRRASPRGRRRPRPAAPVPTRSSRRPRQLVELLAAQPRHGGADAARDLVRHAGQPRLHDLGLALDARYSIQWYRQRRFSASCSSRVRFDVITTSGRRVGRRSVPSSGIDTWKSDRNSSRNASNSSSARSISSIRSTTGSLAWSASSSGRRSRKRSE